MNMRRAVYMQMRNSHEDAIDIQMRNATDARTRRTSRTRSQPAKQLHVQFSVLNIDSADRSHTKKHPMYPKR
jgi:hypothetical protein